MRWGRFIRRGAARVLGLAVLIVALGTVLIPSFPPYQVRIDSGRSRSSAWVARWQVSSVPGEDRIKAAAARIGIPAEWCTIARYAPSDGGRSVIAQYYYLPTLLEVEPALGERMLADLARYLQDGQPDDRYPPTSFIARHVEMIRDASDSEPWNVNQLRMILRQIGYAPTPGGDLERMLQQIPEEP